MALGAIGVFPASLPLCGVSCGELSLCTVACQTANWQDMLHSTAHYMGHGKKQLKVNTFNCERKVVPHHFSFFPFAVSKVYGQ